MTKLASSWTVSVLLKLSKIENAERRGPRFLRLAALARARIMEISAVEAVALVKEGAILIDVREAEEFRRGHIPRAQNLSRGLIEINIENRVPDLDAAIVCYCGAGNRSALVADSLQRMGYKNVRVIAGGLQAWLQTGLPVKRLPSEMEDE